MLEYVAGFEQDEVLLGDKEEDGSDELCGVLRGDRGELPGGHGELHGGHGELHDRCGELRRMACRLLHGVRAAHGEQYGRPICSFFRDSSSRGPGQVFSTSHRGRSFSVMSSADQSTDNSMFVPDSFPDSLPDSFPQYSDGMDEVRNKMWEIHIPLIKELKGFKRRKN